MSGFTVHSFGDSQKVIFLLAGWKTTILHFWLFSKMLELHGFHCLTYTFHDSFFSPDTHKTVKNFKEAQQDIIQRIQSFKQQGVTDFSIFGTSLGTVLALMVAKDSPDITRVVLNLSGYNLAKVVHSWGIRVFPEFHESFAKKGITVKKLEKTWISINPDKIITSLHKKNILLHLSYQDEILPYSQGLQLLEKLRLRNNVQIVTTSYLNHFFSGTYFLFRFRRYVRFLKSHHPLQ